ncbi:beta carbonic anhydrase 5, chloroplastic isoform X2, partial [Tanacetum coccineum]
MGRSLQRDLNRIAEAADTSTPEGLSFVLQAVIIYIKFRLMSECLATLLNFKGSLDTNLSLGYRKVDVKRSVEEGEKRFNQLSIEVCLCCYNRPCEINDALEFSVNALQVENILVTGHSRCGGIHALMSMDDEDNSSFIKNWVVVGKVARSSTKATTSNLSFDQQCKHCKKVNKMLDMIDVHWSPNFTRFLSNDTFRCCSLASCAK